MFMELLSKIFIEHWASMIHILNLFVLLTLIVLFVIARKTRKRWTRINDYNASGLTTDMLIPLL